MRLNTYVNFAGRCAEAFHYYETNLVSNISIFTPATSIDPENLKVLLCSNPTRDLFFSGQEAQKIAECFRSGLVHGGPRPGLPAEASTA